jgi:hypothetical protein
MRLDLRRDFADIHAHLAERVRELNPAGGYVLGGPGPVKMVEVGYEYAQDGWVVIAFGPTSVRVRRISLRRCPAPAGEW